MVQIHNFAFPEGVGKWKIDNLALPEAIGELEIDNLGGPASPNIIFYNKSNNTMQIVKLQHKNSFRNLCFHLKCLYIKRPDRIPTLTIFCPGRSPSLSFGCVTPFYGIALFSFFHLLLHFPAESPRRRVAILVK